MKKRPWKDFADVRSQSFVRDLTSEAQAVSPDDLVDMQQYRHQERTRICAGYDPLRTLPAYAQEELIYNARGELVIADRKTYDALPRERRLNKFGPAYRRDAKFWLNKTLADIVVGAAIHLYQTQAWTTVLYDGLRTVEGAYNLYRFAEASDIENGLLALPGESAHNKGLAVDSMMHEPGGEEAAMGGHFDHLDMATNHRVYSGRKISSLARHNRLVREIAFMRSALAQGLLIAPLRNEFWDDRLPENRADLWRVLESAARCLKIPLLSEDDEKLRKKDRKAFAEKWEQWSYADFLERWHATFKGHEAELEEMLGVKAPPPQEKIEFYHGDYHPIYDRDLKASGKHLTEKLA